MNLSSTRSKSAHNKDQAGKYQNGKRTAHYLLQTENPLFQPVSPVSELCTYLLDSPAQNSVFRNLPGTSLYWCVAIPYICMRSTSSALIVSGRIIYGEIQVAQGMVHLMTGQAYRQGPNCTILYQFRVSSFRLVCYRFFLV